MAVVNVFNVAARSGIFSNANTVINANCNNTAWIGNNASHAFDNCQTVERVTNLNNNITNMDYAFNACGHLVSVDYLPLHTQTMRNTFAMCARLENSPEIPPSVTNMVSTFSQAGSLINATPIPNLVTNMYISYWFCNNLVIPPDLSNATSLQNMCLTFAFCGNLTDMPVIPNSVLNMQQTFISDSSLVNTTPIPASVDNLNSTFYGCRGLKTMPDLTNATVTGLPQTFYGCQDLVNTTTIPNSVTNLFQTFGYCRTLNTTPIIPNSVTTLAYTFDRCWRLINVQSIPNSVTNLVSTFNACTSLQNVPAIPLSVVNMQNTFSGCTNLQGDVIILSKDINDATNCFYGSDTYTKNIYISFNYLNDVRTPTYNAFIAAGYAEEGSPSTINNAWLRNMDIANVIVTTTPPDANVVLNATGYTQSGKMITVRKNTQVNWNVSCWGYGSQSGTVIPVSDNLPINVVLQKGVFTATVNYTPATATLTLTAEGASQEDNHITAEYETIVHYEVKNDGYFTQEGDVELVDNVLLDIDLIRTHYTVAINPIPGDAIVTLAYDDHEPEATTSMVVPYLSTVTWTVSKQGYITASGTFTEIRDDLTFDVELIPNNNLLIATATPGTYTVNVDKNGFYELTAVGGAGGSTSSGSGGSGSYHSGEKAAIEGV